MTHIHFKLALTFKIKPKQENVEYVNRFKKKMWTSMQNVEPFKKMLKMLKMLKMFKMCIPILIFIYWKNKPSFCLGSCNEIRARTKLQNKTLWKHFWNALETFCQAQSKPASQSPGGGWDSLNLTIELNHPPIHHPPTQDSSFEFKWLSPVSTAS